MDKRQIKYYSDAYDALYNLNSLNYKYNDIMRRLEEEVKGMGFKFILNQRSQKFKLKVIK